MKRIFAVGAIAALAPAAHGATAVGLVSLTSPIPGASGLVTFDTDNPSLPAVPVLITGLQTGEQVLAIDVNPANGALYGLGSSGRLYQLNPTTGAATQVGTGTFAVGLSGADFDLAFNPVTGQAVVTSNTGQNFRIDPATGQVIDANPSQPGVQTDPMLSYAAGDVNAAASPRVTGLAFSSDNSCATSSTLYGIDLTQGVLVTLSPANSGTLHTAGTLNGNLAGASGFDISPLTGQAFLSVHPSGIGSGSTLYSVSLSNGHVTPLGSIGAVPLAVNDIAVVSGGQSCPADVDNGSGTGTKDGGVTIDDLVYYLDLFSQGNICADLDNGSGTGTRDQGVTIDDLLYFLQHYYAGC